MLDIRWVRENLERVKNALDDRGYKFPLEKLIELDSHRREIVQEVEELRSRRNAASAEIAELKRQKADANELVERMRIVGARIKELDVKLSKIEEDMNLLILDIPNIPHVSVPHGKDETENVVVKDMGEIPSFSFPALPHWEIGERLNILDFERASKITGSRFCIYYGLGARLELALISFMMDMHGRKHGYREVIPPFIVNETSMTGTGQLPKFAEDLFKLEGWPYYLVPTAEVPVTNIHRDEIIDEERLPIKYAAFTPCFRSEAGSYGKDTRGIVRQHQFNKVELVKFSHPESSYQELEDLLLDAEDVLKALNLPYRVISLCTGDLGFSAAKTYDIEVWLPGQNRFCEISSCSNFEDFQARRANIRFRPKGQTRTRLLHTLNGSGLAVGRTVVAILENYQQEDGSVVIPEALRPYMGGATCITHKE